MAGSRQGARGLSPLSPAPPRHPFAGGAGRGHPRASSLSVRAGSLGSHPAHPRALCFRMLSTGRTGYPGLPPRHDSLISITVIAAAKVGPGPGRAGGARDGQARLHWPAGPGQTALESFKRRPCWSRPAGPLTLKAGAAPRRAAPPRPAIIMLSMPGYARLAAPPRRRRSKLAHRGMPALTGRV